MAQDRGLDLAMFRASQQLDHDLFDLNRELIRECIRLEAVNDRQDQILATVAHDLRTPLGVIVGFVDVLRRRLAPKLDDEDRMLLDRIEAQSGRMLQMAEDLVDASAIERGILSLERSDVDLGPALEELVLMHTPPAERKGITLELDLRDGLPLVRADRARITQVIDNLLSNAIKFTPVDEQATITVSCWAEDDQIRVAVADQGVGIEGGLQARLFEPFARAGATGTAGEPSTGLGLAISRSLIRAHGGDISLESEVGIGTTVIITLPIDPPVDPPSGHRGDPDAEPGSVPPPGG